MFGSSSSSKTKQTSEEFVANMPTQDYGRAVTTQVGIDLKGREHIVDISTTDHGALDLASEIAVGAYNLVSSGLDKSTANIETALQTAEGTIDKSISLAEFAAKTETENLMGDFAKYGALVVAVIAAAYVLVKRKK